MHFFQFMHFFKYLNYSQNIEGFQIQIVIKKGLTFIIICKFSLSLILIDSKYKMSNATYLDEFMDKMYLVPNDINRYLRLIRTLDKRSEAVQQVLNQLQSKFLNQLKEYKQSMNGTINVSVSNSKKLSNGTSNGQVPSSLRADYEKILTRQKQLYGYSKEKYQISQQLKVIVSDYYEQIDVELKNKLKEKTEEEQQIFLNRRKGAVKFLQNNILNLTGQMNNGSVSIGGKIGTSSLGVNGYSANNALFNGQFMYDNKQPTYCYCGRASFGEMVMCESPYCEREWFHTDCIDEKNLPEKWYCSQCQKQKQKTRNPHSRSFFVNRQSA